MNRAGLQKSYIDAYRERKLEEMSLLDYLEQCEEDSSLYASPHERLRKAIGKPNLIDTSKDERLGRLFFNRIIPEYPTFSMFYGMETIIENFVQFLTSASQGLDEARNILYFLGPVGGGKSSLVERMKELMEHEPFYALKAGDIISPVLDHPFGLYSSQFQRNSFQKEFPNINVRRIPSALSPWVRKRLAEFKGDITRFNVVRLHPSVLDQIAIAVTEPGDENTQDISDLVGKTDIRKLEEFSQDDPDSYSYSGGLCRANQGMLEFCEMFKAPIKTLNPLLFATMEGRYAPTEAIGVIPFNGLIVAHSNEAEWEKFRNDPKNEAFIDRISLVKVPYVLRVTEEVKIYEKLIQESELKNCSLAPHTLKMLASFLVLSRLKEPENSTLRAKRAVYDGESLKGKDPKAKMLEEYMDDAGVDEGMTGISTRFGFKVLSQTFNYDHGEVAANPVHLMAVLEKRIQQAQFGEEREKQYLGEFLKGIIVDDFKDDIAKVIREAFVESHEEYGQNIFDRYITYADHWCNDEDYRDPDTSVSFDKNELNNELEGIEKPAGIANPKDFRNEVVRYAWKYQAANNQKNPAWKSYEKMREVIEKKIFANIDELLPVISFDKKKSEEEQQKHSDFVQRMVKLGYTEKQVRLLVEWHIRVEKNA